MAVFFKSTLFAVEVKKPHILMKKDKKTLDIVLIIVGAFLAAFIIATVVIYTVNGWPYDTLIPCVVGGGLLETVNTMIITVNKIRHKTVDDAQDIE